MANKNIKRLKDLPAKKPIKQVENAPSLPFEELEEHTESVEHEPVKPVGHNKEAKPKVIELLPLDVFTKNDFYKAMTVVKEKCTPILFTSDGTFTDFQLALNKWMNMHEKKWESEEKFDIKVYGHPISNGAYLLLAQQVEAQNSKIAELTTSINSQKNPQNNSSEINNVGTTIVYEPASCSKCAKGKNESEKRNFIKPERPNDAELTIKNECHYYWRLLLYKAKVFWSENKNYFRNFTMLIMLFITTISVGLTCFIARDNSDLRLNKEKNNLIRHIIFRNPKENPKTVFFYIDMLYTDTVAHRKEIKELWK